MPYPMKKLLFLCLFPLVQNFSSAQVKIEDLLSVPFPTNLIQSKDGNAIAWVFNNQGVRNIYLEDVNNLMAKPLTHYDSDNGLDIKSLAFSQKGNGLVFVRGNKKNGKGEAANPALLQEKAEEAVYWVDIEGKNLKKLGAGYEPQIAPDNDRVVFIQSGQVYINYIDSNKEAIKLFQTRGIISSLKFSPDGNRLAFVSNRTDHSFIGVYDFLNKTLIYPDPSVDMDMAPIWSPDGKSLAFIRSPSEKDRLPFTEAREGNPWSIRLMDLNRGINAELWKADKGKGSVLFTQFPTGENLILWAAGNQIIFPWEKDGWQHLYALDIEKKTYHLLSPGDGEVENMVLSKDQSEIIFNTNIGDSPRRHIHSVNIQNGKITEITRGNGIEWSPVPTNQGIVVFQSTATRPGWPYLIKPSGEKIQLAGEWFPKTFPETQLVIPQEITFHAEDGLLIHAQIFYPPGYQASKKYPALIFFHGGSKRQMLLGYSYMDYYSNDYSMNEFNALHGYIVLSVNYRSGIGYGLDFREALHYGANGGSEYKDVLAAGLFMKNRSDIDPKKIGIWGGSYGGYLTAMGLSRNSDIFSCGVDIHGVHNWSEELKNWVADYDPATRNEFARIAVASSPVSFLSGWKSPVLFIHGDDDRNVPFNETVMMIEKLRKQNVYFEQLIFPDEVHSFLLHSNWLKAYHASIKFFTENLLK
jgi:dipeptidyl aminopeptidase/acylaminoacyl peptidase